MLAVFPVRAAIGLGRDPVHPWQRPRAGFHNRDCLLQFIEQEDTSRWPGSEADRIPEHPEAPGAPAQAEGGPVGCREPRQPGPGLAPSTPPPEALEAASHSSPGDTHWGIPGGPVPASARGRNWGSSGLSSPSANTDNGGRRSSEEGWKLLSWLLQHRRDKAVCKACSPGVVSTDTTRLPAVQTDTL